MEQLQIVKDLIGADKLSEAEKKLNVIQDQISEFEYINQVSIIQEKRGLNDDLFKSALKLYELAQHSKLDAELLQSYIRLIYANWRLDKLEEAQSFIDLGVKLLDGANDDTLLPLAGELYYLAGVINHVMGESLVLIKSWFDKSLEIRLELDDELLLSYTLNALAIVEEDLGNIRAAISYYLSSLEIKEKYSNSLGLARGYFNLAQLYISTGDLNRARELVPRVEEFYSKVEHKTERRMVRELKAQIAYQSGDIKSAINERKTKINIAGLKPDTDQYFAELQKLIDPYMLLGQRYDAEKILQEIANFYNSDESKLTYLLALQSYYANHPSTREKLKSKPIAYKILNHKDSGNYLKINTIYTILTVTFLEISLFSEPEKIQEVRGLLNKLEDYFIQPTIHVKVIRDYILGKIAYFDQNSLEMQYRYNKAQKLAEKNGLTALATQISKDFYSNTVHLSPEMNNAFSANHNQTRYFGSDLQSLNLIRPLRISEPPRAFYIIDSSGLLRYQKNFSMNLKVSSSLFSAFITAIKQFGEEALESDQLKRIWIENYVIVFDQWEQLTLCLIVGGNSSNLEEKIRRFKEKIDNDLELKELLINSKSKIISNDKLELLSESIFIR